MNIDEAIAGIYDADSRAELRAHVDLMLMGEVLYTPADHELIALAMVEAYVDLPENVEFS